MSIFLRCFYVYDLKNFPLYFPLSEKYFMLLGRM